MATSATLLNYYPRFSFRSGSSGSNPKSSCSSSSSSSCSSSPYCSSSDNRQGFNWSLFNFSGISSIWEHKNHRAATTSTTQGNDVSPMEIINEKDEPSHLLVLVHGIMGSPSNWTYAEAELKRRLGRNFLIYASSCNTYTKTFAGIDGAGKRLADEVMELVRQTESLERISFLAHSLGGLIARYAVAVLYKPNASSSNQYDDLATSKNANSETAWSLSRGMIAGLEPINFITLGTPHLGVRGKKQVRSCGNSF
ncbi:unnamed protein product [Ilex paraguariensis]|uniref:DUF676 domain-containing protein n=1 Tax=Ilex paraguariensis TaxID=185542 RepID=A0ABC8SBP8_9AQUA